MRWLRRIAIGVVLGVPTAIGLLWLGLKTERSWSLELPLPTGSFAVGRSIQVWTDAAHPDTLAPRPGAKRELLVWVWYPATAGQAAPMDDYLPPQLRPKGGATNIWTLLTHDQAKVRGHSIREPEVSRQEQSYPVVIMRAGASAPVLNYSTLAEDLASHGYVVVGFDAPYRTGFVVLPDGRTMGRTAQNNPEGCVVADRNEMERCVSRVMTAWTDDIGFVLDRLTRLTASDSTGRFTSRLDMTRVGVFGHSLGGAVAAQFCHEDARCKAGLDIDGAPHGSVIQAGLSQPFMFLLSDHHADTDAESMQIGADIKSIYDRLPPDRRLHAEIRGAFHFTFTDDGALMKSSIVRGLLRAFGRLGISGRRQLAVTAYCMHTFFDAYLKGAGVPPLKIASPLYPEIQVK